MQAFKLNKEFYFQQICFQVTFSCEHNSITGYTETRFSYSLAGFDRQNPVVMKIKMFLVLFFFLYKQLRKVSPPWCANVRIAGETYGFLRPTQGVTMRIEPLIWFIMKAGAVTTGRVCSFTGHYCLLNIPEKEFGLNLEVADFILLELKGIVHPQIWIIYSPSCRCKPVSFLSNVEHKIIYFEESKWRNTMEVNGGQQLSVCRNIFLKNSLILIGIQV